MTNCKEDQGPEQWRSEWLCIDGVSWRWEGPRKDLRGTGKAFPVGWVWKGEALLCSTTAVYWPVCTVPAPSSRMSTAYWELLADLFTPPTVFYLIKWVGSWELRQLVSAIRLCLAQVPPALLYLCHLSVLYSLAIPVRFPHPSVLITEVNELARYRMPNKKQPSSTFRVSSGHPNWRQRGSVLCTLFSS